MFGMGVGDGGLGWRAGRQMFNNLLRREKVADEGGRMRGILHVRGQFTCLGGMAPINSVP